MYIFRVYMFLINTACWKSIVQALFDLLFTFLLSALVSVGGTNIGELLASSKSYYGYLLLIVLSHSIAFILVRLIGFESFGFPYSLAT